MAPWRLSSAASMRQASMAMSWVAPKKPTMTAKPATAINEVAGFDPEISHSPRMISAWVASIHDRRWPRSLVRPGIEVRSSSGAQTNFNA